MYSYWYDNCIKCVYFCGCDYFLELIEILNIFENLLILVKNLMVMWL